MDNIQNIVQMGVDAYEHKLQKYSADQAMNTLRAALIEANGGSTKLNYKNIRDGKCVGLFSIVEQILQRTINDGFTGNEFFMSQVDFRNVAAGDMNEFIVEDSDMFVVSDVANGTQGVRRQRLGGYTTITVPTSMKVIKIYEELNRVLAGQVDFNYFIKKVSDAFRQGMLNDIYTLWQGATAADFGGNAYFPNAGAYDEDTLLATIEHVEAAAGGKKATIIGTKASLRPIQPAIQSDGYKDDLYNLGYAGKFYGTQVVAIPQRHKVNGTDFLLDDHTLTIVAGDDKPIKYITEGNSTVIMGNPTGNADLTQDYFYAENTGLALVLASNAGIGRYKITG